VLSQVKLIAEPWDLGPDGYQLGRFPVGWAEWNGRYRDEVRDFWRGCPSSVGPFAGKLAGSADVFGEPERGPLASVNFVTCHDGFTLTDLVSYERKHNEANLEHNRDGTDDNRSWNCGVEGPAVGAAICDRRARYRRNLLATLLLSQGVPMLLAGDELGRTQRGNNNGYCQDNALSWIDWDGADLDLARFVGQLVELRRTHPVLRRCDWAVGRPVPPSGAVDLAWFTPRGLPMTEREWLDPDTRAVVAVLDGRAASGPATATGDVTTGPSLVVMVNGGPGRILCRIPANAWPRSWRCVLDTSEQHRDRPRPYRSGDQLRLASISVVVLSSAS
jgi:glycogen operon protein